jgi:hypothetical protein
MSAHTLKFTGEITVETSGDCFTATVGPSVELKLCGINREKFEEFCQRVVDEKSSRRAQMYEERARQRDAEIARYHIAAAEREAIEQMEAYDYENRGGHW